MAKILLVEDDSNLREIYGARLGAEGHEITSAKDGEEALAVAVKAKPDLIISDVMMPKISGFDMLDILRSTAETKDVKIIMMTALSQDEDRKRGTDLGADRYIVKSQVTLDDVVAIVNEVLSAKPTPSSSDDDDTSADSGVGSDDSTQATDDEINDQVEKFVASSPLMNGTPPTPASASASSTVQPASEAPSQPTTPDQSPPASPQIPVA
ncbi:response regulator [Candidatus Nomurabacteria bacterium]|nr:response regulator [Candidatus Nomurabacteria bacterium]